MICFSFSSFFMSMIFANIVILFLYIIFQNQKLMIKLGLPILSGAVFVAILRMVLPIEFLFLSHNIYFSETISKIIWNFNHPYFLDHFSLWSFVIIIWIIGSLFFTIRYIKTEHDFSKEVNCYSEKLPESAPAYQVFKQIQQELPKTQRIELRIFPFIQTPSIYGIHKPYILLPKELNLNEKQLYYILHHEISHYLHHDSLLKLGVKFLCIIYWWNPFCRFLQKKADEILEMRIDQTIVKQTEQKLEYLECLLFVANHIASTSHNINSSKIISFSDESSIILNRRFQMLLDNKQQFHKSKKYILLFCFTILFLLSFVFIFEASYMTPEDNTNRDIPSTNNSYFIEREDGRYDFYIDGAYVTTEDSLEYYSNDIPVYREEVKQYEMY